jgi:SAM-dependent methyltransferase/uncharacterized protein YbaR (Trm112 family)
MRQHPLEQIASCPITRQDLRILGESDLAWVNQQIAEGQSVRFDSTPVQEPLQAGLITADGTFVYPIADEIAFLLPEFAIGLTPGCFKDARIPDYQSSVRDFYDHAGWTPCDNGYYADAHFHEDLRPVSHHYIRRCHLRVNDYLPPKGRYILDVASGPIQYATYLSYSRHYEARVCVDVSLAALHGARQALPPGHGLFVMGNIRNLPFKPDVFDAVVSLHTVYHIPADQQHAVFDELHRVLKPKGRAIAVYTWGNTSLLNQPRQVLSALFYGTANRLGPLFRRHFRPLKPPELPVFFYHPHPYRWFKQQTWDYPFTILCWRSISVDSLKLFFHAWALGRPLLRLIFYLEGRFPKFFAPIGQYPMFLIDKD